MKRLVPLWVIIVVTVFLQGPLLYAQSNRSPILNPDLKPQTTESIIRKNGLPDMTIPVIGTEDEDRLLLYEDESETGFRIDVIYYVEEDGDVTHEIHNIENGKNSRKTPWYKETLADVKETIQTLKKEKEAWDESIAALPGLNYFDRVKVLSDEMMLGLGKGPDQINSTLILDPGKEAVNLTFKIPFS
jgi:hypothetical protein